MSTSTEVKQEEKRLWKSKDGSVLRMEDMSEVHLKKAFLHVAGKLFHYFQSSKKLDELQEQLEEVAKERGIKLDYPDEKFPSKKWGNYFEHRRKYKKTSEVETVDILTSK